jgi:hypothetical protein
MVCRSGRRPHARGLRFYWLKLLAVTIAPARRNGASGRSHAGEKRGCGFGHRVGRRGSRNQQRGIALSEEHVEGMGGVGQRRQHRS